MRRFHLSRGDVAGEGTFRVERSPKRAGRLLATLLHLPRAGDAVPVRLVIRRPAAVAGTSPVELWHRHFGTDAVDSVQTVSGTGLVERVGRIEPHFELVAGDGRLRFVHLATRLRLGPFTPPLPRAFSPRVGRPHRPRCRCRPLGGP